MRNPKPPPEVPKEKTKADLRQEKEREIEQLKTRKKAREQEMRGQEYSDEEIRFEMNMLDNVIRQKQEELYRKYF